MTREIFKKGIEGDWAKQKFVGVNYISFRGDTIVVDFAANTTQTQRNLVKTYLESNNFIKIE